VPEITRSKYLVMAGWEHAPHLDDKAKQELLDSTPEHLKLARSKGIPRLGDGAVFPISEDKIRIEPIPIPDHWVRICGLDFGWDHPTAACWLAWDRDADIIYVYDCYGASRTVISVHASAIRSRGTWIPIAWPHDGYQTKDAKSGEQLAQQFRNEGLPMRLEHAQFPPLADGDPKESRISVEAGIQEMLTRMQTGRWKVFSTCTKWFEEFRLYRREKGVIVKLLDDHISASRYGMMDLRFAVTPPRETRRSREQKRYNWRVM
jgi:hypothetical protein